jgi:hypothetical protein
MKKVYFAPAVEEVELEIENVILVGSGDPNVPGTNNDDNDSEDVIDI